MAGPTRVNTAEIPIGAVINAILNAAALAAEIFNLSETAEIRAAVERPDDARGVVLNVNCGPRYPYGHEPEEMGDSEDYF